MRHVAVHFLLSNGGYQNVRSVANAGSSTVRGFQQGFVAQGCSTHVPDFSSLARTIPILNPIQNTNRCSRSITLLGKLIWSNWYIMAQSLRDTKAGIHHNYDQAQGFCYTKALYQGHYSKSPEAALQEWPKGQS